MRARLNRVAAAAAFALLLGTSMSAHAQLNPFGRRASSLRLQQSDYAMLSDTAQSLYKDESAADGASKSWNNPATGAAGKVTLAGSFTAHRNNIAYACRKVRYDISVKGNKQTALYTVNWCKTPDQQWKILS